MPMVIMVYWFLALTCPALAHADFGEVDILVRESIERFFSSEGREVDMGRFSYTAAARTEGTTLILRSEVWGEQRLIAPYWGWFDCMTKLPVLASGRYGEPETECLFDPE